MHKVILGEIKVRYPELYYPIIKILENGPKKGDSIINLIKSKIGEEFPKNEKKGYTKAFTRLLEDKKIDIVSFDGKRSQNIDCKDFTYTLIKTKPSDILKIIKSSSKNQDKKKELQKLFIQRVKKSQIKFMRNWRELLLSSGKIDLSKEAEFIEVTGKLEYDILSQEIKTHQIKVEGGTLTPLIYFPAKKVRIKGFGLEITIPKKREFEELHVMTFEKEHLEKFFTKNTPRTIVLDKKFFKKELSEIDFLKEFNLYEPRKRSLEEISSLFEEVMVNLNLKNKVLKDQARQQLALALSEDPKADQYLYEVITLTQDQ